MPGRDPHRMGTGADGLTRQPHGRTASAVPQPFGHSVPPHAVPPQAGSVTAALSGTQLRFGLLGDFEIHLGNRRVDLGGARIRTLLAVLLIFPGQPVNMDRLVEFMWASPPPSAVANLRTYATALRRRLDSVAPGASARLSTTPSGYLFTAGAAELDLLQFEELADQGERCYADDDIAGAADRFDLALGLWRGQPLADLRYGPLLTPSITRLQERYLAVTQSAVDVWLAAGRENKVIDEAVRVLGAFPLHEPLWARLMLALHRSGRRADALAVYRRARDYLIEEVGLEPGAELQETHQFVLSVEPDARAPLDRDWPGR
jgi:DNA-binding SARP family transcriptional activator